MSDLSGPTSKTDTPNTNGVQPSGGCTSPNTNAHDPGGHCLTGSNPSRRIN